MLVQNQLESPAPMQRGRHSLLPLLQARNDLIRRILEEVRLIEELRLPLMVAVHALRHGTVDKGESDG